MLKNEIDIGVLFFVMYTFLNFRPSKRGMYSIVMEYACTVTVSLTMNCWRILSWMSGSWCKKNEVL